MPALFVAAERDEVIPQAHARNLADHWGGRAQWVLIEGATHNSIAAQKGYWSSIRGFLNRL